MTFDRRRFLQATGVAGATLVVSGTAARARSTTPGTGAPGSGVPADAPRTGFEQRNGASWTTHAEELAFLATVASRSSRVRMDEVGRTAQGRPLHLVTVSLPGAGRGAGAPSTLFIGSQHGNEPAGRECALTWLRDLAFTSDSLLTAQLAGQTLMFIPSANPDGRQNNTRGNSRGTDINRDHLTLATEEARAIAEVLNASSPSLVLDLHEYGPGQPVLYDDDVLYLWPRNLNVDAPVRDLSRTLAREYIKKGAEAAGYTADEYGLSKVLDIEVAQTAGDEDEGICRNLMGLRHSLGILVESAVTQNPRRGPQEVTGGAAAVQSRRVESQRQVLADTLRFMRDQGDVAQYAHAQAPGRKTAEGRDRSAPVYFYGADNDPSQPGEFLMPPPSAYRLTAAQEAQAARTLDLHGVRREAQPDGTFVVSMAQPAEPVIPLLLDARARREVVQATPVD